MTTKQIHPQQLAGAIDTMVLEYRTNREDAVAEIRKLLENWIAQQSCSRSVSFEFRRLP